MRMLRYGGPGSIDPLLMDTSMNIMEEDFKTFPRTWDLNEDNLHLFISHRKNYFLIFEGSKNGSFISIVPGTMSEVYWKPNKKAWFYEPNKEDSAITALIAFNCMFAPLWMCEAYSRVETV